MNIDMLKAHEIRWGGLVTETMTQFEHNVKITDSSDTTVIVHPSGDIVVEHNHTLYDEEEQTDTPYFGKAFMNANRASMYDTLTPVYVLTYGSLDDIPSLNAVMESEDKIGSNPLYPDLSNFNVTSSAMFNAKINMLLADNDDIIIRTVDPLIVLILRDAPNQPTAVRIDVLNTCVSLEYGNCKVVKFFDKTISVHGVFKALHELVEPLDSLMHKYTGEPYSTERAKYLTDMFHRYMISSTPPSVSKGDLPWE